MNICNRRKFIKNIKKEIKENKNDEVDWGLFIEYIKSYYNKKYIAELLFRSNGKEIKITILPNGYFGLTEILTIKDDK